MLKDQFLQERLEGEQQGSDLSGNPDRHPKGSHREAAGVVSWHAVDLNLLLHLPALHWLSMVRSTEEEVNSVGQGMGACS